MLSSSMAIQFKIKHIERASALVLNPTGNIFLRIRHSFLKVYRDSSSGEETVLEDHIVSEHGLPEIVIPSNALEPPVSCSLFLANALLSLNLDTPLREYLHRVVTAESVRLSHGGRGFCLYAFIEAVNVVVVESQVVDWVIKKFESMVVMEKLRRRRVDDPVGVKQVDGPCAVCLEELKMGDEGEDNSNLIISMPCSHVFHQNCIFRWLEKENSCPLCRQAVKLEAADYHLSPALE